MSFSLSLSVLEPIRKSFFIGTTGPNSLIIAGTKRTTKSFNGSGNASVNGLLNASHVCCSLPLARRVFLSTGLKTCKARMDRDALRLRSLVILLVCPGVTHASTGWICHLTQIMRVWNQNCCLLLSMFRVAFWGIFLIILFP